MKDKINKITEKIKEKDEVMAEENQKIKTMVSQSPQITALYTKIENHIRRNLSIQCNKLWNVIINLVISSMTNSKNS